MPISDEEFIARIRKQQRPRRWIGVAGMVLGTAVCALFFFWIAQLDRQSREFLDTLDSQPPPTTQQLEERREYVRYGTGMAVGFAIGTTFMLGAVIATHGFIYTFLKDRRTRLLLKLWDDRHTHPGDRRLDL